MANLSNSVLQPISARLPTSLVAAVEKIWYTYSPALLQPKGLASMGLAYLLLVRILRYRRLAQHQSQFPPSRPLSEMTIQQAQDIWKGVSQLEFPFTVEKGIQFALFRTYGIPTISKTLVETSLFSKPTSASKRYADTAALVTEFLVRDYGSTESIEAIARLNCIHGYHIDRGRILNDDMIYTLALFVREPIAWVERYEWREMDRVEKCAVGVLWKAIGDAMEIKWTGLPGYDNGTGWRDGLHWVEELIEWTEAYEAKHMVPNDDNATVAEQTTAILLWGTPEALKPLGQQAVGALMDERLRRAMKYEDPPAAVSSTVAGFLSLRKFLLRHLALPRPEFLKYHNITDVRTPEGTIFMKQYQSLPYYVKPTFWNRWLSVQALTNRIAGLPVPGDDGKKYFPGGYRTVDVGPPIGKKNQKVEEMKVEEVAKAKCPYVF